MYETVDDVDTLECGVPVAGIDVALVFSVGNVGSVVDAVRVAAEFVENTEDFEYVVEVSVADIEVDYDIETVADMKF